MKQEPDLFEVFSREAPGVFSAYNGLIRSLIETKGLDAKTKQLLYIGMKIVTGDKIAVMFLTPMAKKAGATGMRLKTPFYLRLQ